MSGIAATWKAIYEDWLPRSDQYEEDKNQACFEYFPPDVEKGDCLVSIYAAVKPK